MEFVKLFYFKFRSLILYGIFGSFSSFLDFCVYTLLFKFAGIHYIIANCCSVLVGISTSFILNRGYNFKVKNHVRRRFITFLCVGICGLIFSNLILFVGIDVLHANNILVKILSIVLVVGFQFLVNKLVTFRE